MLALVVVKSPIKKPAPGSIITIHRAKPVVLGRDPDVDIYLDDTNLSEEHIMFARKCDDWLIEELHSECGTTVDGEQLLGSMKLSTGMLIQAGRFVFKVICKFVSDTADFQMTASPEQPGAFMVQRNGKTLETMRIDRLLSHIRNMDLFDHRASYAAMFRAATDENPVVKIKVERQWPDIYEILYPTMLNDQEMSPEQRIKEQHDALVEAERQAEVERLALGSHVIPRWERNPQSKPRMKKSYKISAPVISQDSVLRTEWRFGSRLFYTFGGIAAAALVLAASGAYVLSPLVTKEARVVPLVQTPTKAIDDVATTIDELIKSETSVGLDQSKTALDLLEVQLKDQDLTADDRNRLKELERRIERWDVMAKADKNVRGS